MVGKMSKYSHGFQADLFGPVKTYFCPTKLRWAKGGKQNLIRLPVIPLLSKKLSNEKPYCGRILIFYLWYNNSRKFLHVTRTIVNPVDNAEACSVLWSCDSFAIKRKGTFVGYIDYQHRV